MGGAVIRGVKSADAYRFGVYGMHDKQHGRNEGRNFGQKHCSERVVEKTYGHVEQQVDCVIAHGLQAVPRVIPSERQNAQRPVRFVALLL